MNGVWRTAGTRRGRSAAGARGRSCQASRALSSYVAHARERARDRAARPGLLGMLAEVRLLDAGDSRLDVEVDPRDRGCAVDVRRCTRAVARTDSGSWSCSARILLSAIAKHDA